MYKKRPDDTIRCNLEIEIYFCLVAFEFQVTSSFQFISYFLVLSLELKGRLDI